MEKKRVALWAYEEGDWQLYAMQEDSAEIEINLWAGLYFVEEIDSSRHDFLESWDTFAPKVQALLRPECLFRMAEAKQQS